MQTFLMIIVAFVLTGTACGRSGPPDGTPGETGAPASPANLDWCVSHAVPESECTRCNPSLIAAFKEKGDWCAGHDLPESQCTICDPSRRQEPPGAVPTSAHETEDRAAQAPGPVVGGDHGDLHVETESHQVRNGAPAGRADYCEEHRVAESRCAICLPSLAGVLTPVPELPDAPARPLLRLENADAARRAGIRAVRAAAPEGSSTLPAWASTAWDEDRVAHITSPAGGVVTAISSDLGETVRAGQVVASVRSGALAIARGEVEAARARERVADVEAARKEALHRQGLASEEARLEAEQAAVEARAAARAAERHLAALTGVEEFLTLRPVREPLGSSLAASSASSTGSPASPSAGAGDDPLDLFLARSPIDGVVVSRDAVPGSSVEGGGVLVTVVDPSWLWILLDLRENHAASVRVGQTVMLEVDALPGDVFVGRVDAVSEAIDPHTRRLRVRASVDNQERRLRANLFGRASIVIGPSEGAAEVPRESIQWIEGIQAVFVRLDDDLFEARAVRTGASRHGRVELLAGVQAGEEVVTDGAFLLKTEVSKGSIGAGCCDVVETLGRER